MLYSGHKEDIAESNNAVNLTTSSSFLMMSSTFALMVLGSITNIDQYDLHQSCVLTNIPSAFQLKSVADIPNVCRYVGNAGLKLNVAENLYTVSSKINLLH